MVKAVRERPTGSYEVKGAICMDKEKDLLLAKDILDRLVADYRTIFTGYDGSTGRWGQDKGMRTCATRAKEELRLVRRLLLEVEKAL